MVISELDRWAGSHLLDLLPGFSLRGTSILRDRWSF